MPTDRPKPVAPWFASSRLRMLISFFLIGHIWAIVGRPLEFATQGPFGTSPSASSFYAPVKAYSQFAYLDHGYAFFAPDPGPSHFIQAAITDKNGKRVEQKFPDLEQQWPRLLYHRHFMLAEFFNDVYHPPGAPPPAVADDAQAAAQWMRGRRRYEAVRDSILHHLRVTHPEHTVAVRRVEHRQPGLPEYLQGGIGTRDERLLRVLFDTPDGLPDSPRDTLGPLPPNVLQGPEGQRGPQSNRVPTSVVAPSAPPMEAVAAPPAEAIP